MIPLKKRLPREAFRERGYRMLATRFFSLKVKNNVVGTNRIAVVVGKSVDKRATQRNFWERQMKTVLLAAPNVSKDIIVTVFPNINTLTKAEATKEIRTAIKTICSPTSIT
jgi:ribonuclease P protein component